MVRQQVLLARLEERHEWFWCLPDGESVPRAGAEVRRCALGWEEGDGWVLAWDDMNN